MYKKQLLKIGGNKKQKIVSLSLLCIALTGIFAGNALASSIDTSYGQYSTANGFATETRPKEDDTSAYIYHYGNAPASVQVRSYGINYSANGSSYYVGVGQSSYLPNYVKENGKSNCYLYITPVSGSAYLYGVWSPDSV